MLDTLSIIAANYLWYVIIGIAARCHDAAPGRFDETQGSMVWLPPTDLSKAFD